MLVFMILSRIQHKQLLHSFGTRCRRGQILLDGNKRRQGSTGFS